jgi:nucleoside diphosphate kinase
MLSSQENLGESYQMYFLCSRKIIPEFSNDRYIIKGTVINESCQELPNDMNLQILVGDSTSHGSKPNSIRMDYSVEYLNDIITLADGVAYYTKTISL